MSKSPLKSKKLGRRKGSREKGYFFRTGRGWYVSLGHSMTKLCYAGTDQPIKDKGTDRTILEQAYEHWVAAHKEALKAAERDAAAAAEQAGSPTV